MDLIERNYKILEERMIKQTDVSLNFGKSIIESELDTGILNVLVKPIIKSFYKYWSDKDARVGTLEQIRITLNSAKEFITSGDGSKEQFDMIINKNFTIYLENDQTNRGCKKKHRNYKRLREVTKKCFITQVEEGVLLLKVDEDIQNYNDLSRATYETKEKAYFALKRQLDFKEEGIAIVEQDDSILNVPIGKNIMLMVLRQAFELTKAKLIEELDKIFNF